VNSSTSTTYHIANAEGSTSDYTVITESIPVNTNFAQSGNSEYSGNVTVISEIDLPDLTKYQFTYDQGSTGNHYGTLHSMELPTGGTISYSFTKSSDAYGNPYTWISSRTTPDGTWTYSSPSVTSNCSSISYVNCQQQVTVTKPSSDYAVYTFTLNGGAWLTEMQSYDSSSNLLSTTTSCYNFVTLGSNGQCSYSVTAASGAMDVYRTAQTTTLPIPGSSVSTTTEYAWESDNVGNLTQLKEWNFGNSPTNAADRTTTVIYISHSSGSYYFANIVDHPVSVTVTDSGGNTVAQTLYCYDYYGSCGGSSFASATGKKNHDDTNYPTTNTVRGDLTQIQRLVSGTSTYLTSSITYDMTGQSTSFTDPKGNITTITSYSDNYYDDNNGNSVAPSAHTTSTPTNGYPTTITPPNSALAVTLGYYYGTGQVAEVTDANGKTDYFHFVDPFFRPTATSLPNGGWTLTAYDVASSKETGLETYTGINSTIGTNCSYCRHDATVFPSSSLPRPASNQLVNDPDGETKVDTTYDSSGRVKTISNPYRGSSTSDVTTLYYDGLDRVYEVEHADGDYAYTYHGAAVTSGVGGQTTQQCTPSSWGHGYP
jgi:hypothetical protein